VTIREYLDRKTQPIGWAFMAALVAWAVAVVCIPLRRPEAGLAGLSTFAVWAIGAIFASRIRCPNCGERLGADALGANQGNRGRKPWANYCRHCGIHFDQQMPSKPDDRP
jgi:hypothetical protein